MHVRIALKKKATNKQRNRWYNYQNNFLKIRSKAQTNKKSKLKQDDGEATEHFALTLRQIML